MKRRSSGLKRIARESLDGQWGLAVAANLIAILLLMAALAPFYSLQYLSGGGKVQTSAYNIASSILYMVMMVLQCGVLRIHLSFARKEQVGLKMLFGEFTREPQRYITLYLVALGIGMFCTMPGEICIYVGTISGAVLAYVIGGALYLAGIVVLLPYALRYSMAALLLVDDCQMEVLEAIDKSRELMEGNRRRLFTLCLSFLGWSVLGILSGGIGMLWIIPYMEQTLVTFYRELIGELEPCDPQMEDFGRFFGFTEERPDFYEPDDGRE